MPRAIPIASFLILATSTAIGQVDDVDAMVERNYYLRGDEARVVFDVRGVENSGWRARVTLASDEVIEEAPLVQNGPTTVTFPTDRFPVGETALRMSIVDDDRILWSGTGRLVQVPPPDDGRRIVQIDQFKRIVLVDGKPSFPMGVFGVFPEHLNEVSEAGFNLTMRWKGATTQRRFDRKASWDHESNQVAVREYLDAIHEAGMFALENPVKLAEERLYIKFRDPDWHTKFPLINHEVTPGVVKQARSHPAVIGYYGYDEPDNFYPDQPDHPKHLLMQDGVEQWYDAVRQLDPYHPIVTLFAVGLRKVEDWQAWDIAARDFYIGRDEPMVRVYDTARQSAEVAWRMRTPFVYTPLFEESSGRPVPLSPKEQRAQTWLSLVADVKGLFYWDWPAVYEPNWQMLKQLAREVKELSPVLLERAPRQVIEYDTPGTENAIKVLIKNHDGVAHLLVANAEPARAEVRFSLPEKLGNEAVVLFDDRELAIEDAVLEDRIEPYGRRVYRLTGAWEQGDTLRISAELGTAVLKPDPTFEPSKRNLIVNGSFEHDYQQLPGWPLGWHPGDSIMESGVVGSEAGRWTPDSDQAHHGERSLRLIKTASGIADSDGLYNLAEAPAAGQTVDHPETGKYTFSVWLKGDRPVRARLMAGWSTMEDFEVGTEWTRYQFSYDRGSPGKSFVRVYLMKEGKLWVDGVQLERGGRATEFESSIVRKEP